mgnify:CR=1 FL=1
MHDERELVKFVRQSNGIEGIYFDEGHLAFDEHLAVLHHIIRHANDKNRPLTESDLLHWHDGLMKWCLGNLAGKYRNRLVMVGEYIAPPFEQIKLFMPKLLDLCNNAMEERDCWDAHHFFESIHPFIDGNGRIGRLLLNWCRIRAGFPLHTVMAVAKFYYYKSIEKWRKENWKRIEIERAIILK